MRLGQRWVVVCAFAFLASPAARTAQAQFIPWDTFIDDASDSICDVVNAGNAQLVVLNTTRQFVIVTGSDVTLVDTFVETNGSVFFEGEPAGVIGFALDSDGLRRLWWTSLTEHRYNPCANIHDVFLLLALPTRVCITRFR